MSYEGAKHSEPEFIIRLQGDSVVEGEDASLNCKVTGDPMPRIQWFLDDGTEIKPSRRHEMNYDLATGDVQLVIKNTRPSDEASYKCVATNRYGTSKTLGLLLLKPSHKPISPKSPSPKRSSDFPKITGCRSDSPLKNIEVPVSNLLPVKEEAEHSSQSEELPDKTHSTLPVPSQEVKFLTHINIF